MRSLALAAVTAAVTAALLAGGSVLAAARGAAPAYVTSDPQPGERRESAPGEVTITFSEPLDDSSKALVLDECGRRIDDRASAVFANELSVGIATTPAGEYRVFYEATGVGGATGTTRGAFGFEVTSGPACGGHATHRDHHGGGHGGGPHGGGHQGHGGGDGHARHGTHSHDHGAPSGGHEHRGSMVGTHEHGTGGHGRHGGQQGHGDHIEAAPEPQAERPAEADLAAAPGQAATADGAALLLGLGLAAALGVLGGWFLRVSTPS